MITSACVLGGRDTPTPLVRRTNKLSLPSNRSSFLMDNFTSIFMSPDLKVNTSITVEKSSPSVAVPSSE
jgi:hypothetical protein